MEELKTNEYLRGIVMNLPTSPGIYQYLNAEGTIIYVGKAKNLKRRVYSYFSKDHHSAKTRILVSRIADIRYIVVNTEEDALLLENNLIKKYKPRYNVLHLLRTLYPFPFHASHARPYQETVPSPYLPPGSHTRKHSGGQIQGLPGISHQELQRSLHRSAIARRIYGKHCIH